ncbi:hypothetical protein EOM81_11925, partial [bacterium]|nr:hypothetical protein [bacterium]
KPIPELIPEQVKPIVETRAKLAEMFNTNPRYISEAQRLKETKPEVHKQVIRGEKTITEVKKEEKQEAKQVAKQQRAEIEAEISKNNASDPIRKHIENISDGDWFRLGGHLLYCGDTSSLEFKNGLTTCALAIADPPYNAGVAEWDNEFEWRHDYIAELAKVTVVTPGISSLFDFAKKSNMPYAWSVACWISNGMTRGKIGFGNWIYGAIFSKESIHRNEQDFLKISIQGDNIEHKGQKPVAFISWIIELFSDENDVVIDPFGGTGTTLLICEKMNRKCVIGEKDPESCKKIIARWELATGREAEKI